MKEFLKRYKFGFDFWALILFAAIMIPNIVYWCLPQYDGLSAEGAIDTAATVFQVIGIALLLFVVQRERKRKAFADSLFMTSCVFLALDYLAWVLYFCGYSNSGVILFLAACPCLALILFEIERRNWFALVPTAVFAVLHIVAFL